MELERLLHTDGENAAYETPEGDVAIVVGEPDHTMHVAISRSAIEDMAEPEMYEQTDTVFKTDTTTIERIRDGYRVVPRQGPTIRLMDSAVDSIAESLL